VKTHSASIVIDAPIEKVYGFHRVAENIGRITPPGVALRVEKGEGEEVTLHMKRFGMSTRMTVRFIEIDPPNRLVDEQIAGPFRFWRQTRIFERVGEGTRLTDRVEYEVGFGLLGAIAGRLVIDRQIASMFRHRQNALRKILEAGSGP
jgi:ligand-binding SRPBCC domain-containing protein